MVNLFSEPSYIAVEGPLRAGKTTLARVLAETLHARYIEEPERNPFLDRFYAGEPSAFATQMWFLEQRYQQLRGLNEAEDTRPVVADYIFEKDKIFACLNLTDAELGLYNRFYQPLHRQLRTPDLVIYLRAKPEVLRRRLRMKNLVAEQGISDAYIEQVAASYEHFFAHYSASDLLVVETSEIDFVANHTDLQVLLSRLREPVNGTQYYLPLPSAVHQLPGDYSGYGGVY